MSSAPAAKHRRWGRWLLVLLAALILAAVLARRPLVGFAAVSALRLAGASRPSLEVETAGPGLVVFRSVELGWRTHRLTIERVSIERSRWWSWSLGKVTLQGARLPLAVDGSDVDPFAWSSYEGGDAGGVPLALPMDALSVEGALAVRAAATGDREVRILARVVPAGVQWKANVEARGPGLEADMSADFAPISGTFALRVDPVRIDLAQWQEILQRVVLIPGGTWRLAGDVAASADISRREGKLRSSGWVRLEKGSARNEDLKLTLEGLAFDVPFEDFDSIRSGPASLKVGRLAAGGFAATDLEARFTLEGPEKVVVSALGVSTLGGRVRLEPFKIFPRNYELEAVVAAEGLDIAQILVLAPDVPARASGRVDARVPVRIDHSGFRFRTGWIDLHPGSRAEVELHAEGLLTAGMEQRGPKFDVLRRIEGGLLRLQISTLRLDIYPPDRPAGRSAQLHLAGDPVDPGVKAPVRLDLNVNGPLEKLIRIGLDSRVELGTKR